MLIKDLFLSDVTRDIPPVVYFHDQAPEKLKSEVDEYIITGGWPEAHPNHKRVPRGIHEEYVRLLTGMTEELSKKGGPELPCAWISGFYGSGKSSFAKLLGLSLDGVELPDGRVLSDAWLKRDTSPKGQALRDAWSRLIQVVEQPLAVVFDVGSVARDNEHIHAVAIRQLQLRLGYSRGADLVADYELDLERDGEYDQFLACAQRTLGKPWSEVKDRSLVEEDFSLVLSELYPQKYTDPMSWILSRGGTHSRAESPEEAVGAIKDMLRFRANKRSLFFVVDEVSQYVVNNRDRVDRLRAFATALGSGLRGQAWFIALGQQKLDEEADDSFLTWARDRFPPKLRVHLAATNIRDVVHKRLLQKKPEAEAQLRQLFDSHRPDLKLFAYGCQDTTAEEFIDVYPLLPGQIDLILQLTTALRSRSSRAQGDDQAIRGLLQLLGELFRDRELAEMEVGRVVTLDQIYEVQHTALDSDVQGSMARIQERCSKDANPLMLRAAKAVALLELIQDDQPTSAKLVAQCLYERIGQANQEPAVTEALEELRRRNLLGYSEKEGYKIQSSVAEEWERDRKEIHAPSEVRSQLVQDALKFMIAEPERPRLHGRPFPWAAVFSDGRRAQDVSLLDPRDDASVRVDFRLLKGEEAAETSWLKRSDESTLRDRIVWVCGDPDALLDVAKELRRSDVMVTKMKPRRSSLNAARKLLLQQEENRLEDLQAKLRKEVAACWFEGLIYFRGRSLKPADCGASFNVALQGAANRLIQDLYPHCIATQVQPSELLIFVEQELNAPAAKFLPGELGILELDSGRYVPTCSGVVPSRVFEFIEAEGGVTGSTLLSHFGGPPYGYTANVVKACVAGLLRGSKLRITPETGAEITSTRDAGVRDLLEKDRGFRRASILPAGDDDVGVQARARICKFFEQALGLPVDREDHAIADTVANAFPEQATRLRDVYQRLNALPCGETNPPALSKLQEALESCLRSCRQTKPTVRLVKQHLDALRDGFELLGFHDAELKADAISAVNAAYDVSRYQSTQLEELGVAASNADAATARIRQQLELPRPWREIASLDDDLSEVRATYISVRQDLLARQEDRADQARARIKAREGFSTLSGDQSHQVLRPLSVCLTNTSAEAISPSLSALKDPFDVALRKAEEEANLRLDQLLSEGDKPVIRRFDLGQLRNRELSSKADVEAFLDDLRGKLLSEIEAGSKLRLF